MMYSYMFCFCSIWTFFCNSWLWAVQIATLWTHKTFISIT